MIISLCMLYLTIVTDGGYLPYSLTPARSGFYVLYLSADIDECEDQRSCPHNSTCVNSLVAFDCVCTEGYKYNKTKGTCEGENYVVKSYFHAACVFAAWKMPQLGQENVPELTSVLNTQPSLDKHDEGM